MDQYKYDFSVVMAVYNVEAYLREAVESLIHQTIGFSRIQLIMVDDGSTDGSGAICDEYKKKYPENVVVIHKENGGVSSARNSGLDYVQGKYLNFMDSDDKLDLDALKKVFIYFRKYGDQTDAAAIPMKYFDSYTGEHPQNKKFSYGLNVLNLEQNPYVTNLSASSTYVKASSIGNLKFDERLSSMEDAKFILEILFDKMTLGLVKDTVYWYRKRIAGMHSATESASIKKSWYLPQLKYFSKWALDEAKAKYKYIPKFVQYEVMYDLQWKFQQNNIPSGILTGGEEKEYRELLYTIVRMVDDDVIMEQNQLWNDQKAYILQMKYGSPAQLREFSGQKPNKKDIELYYGSTVLTTVSQMKTVLEFIKLESESCILEGFHVLFGVPEDTRIVPCLIVNGKLCRCEIIDRTRKESVFIGDKINKVIGFRGKIPVPSDGVRIYAAVHIAGRTIVRLNVKFGQFFPVCNVYRQSYAMFEKYILTVNGAQIRIDQKPSIFTQTVREGLLLEEIWQKNFLGGRKAVAGRLYYHIMHPFKRKDLWIISDRILKADDNGEALFRYLSRNKPENTRVVFAVSKNSDDYNRMKEVGECVDAMSFRHKLLHLLCDVNISAHADYHTGNPFRGHHDALRDLLQHQHFVFLQHGITKDDVSGWLNRYDQNISGIVTAAEREYRAFIEGDYGYTEKEIWLTGFPRFDRLYRAEKKWITVMPTWRKKLMGRHDEQTGKWSVRDDFGKSKYYQFYNSLINSERLLAGLEKYGYTLKFFPHPNLQPYIDLFDHDSRTGFLSPAKSYRDIYAWSDLVVTDYSSAVFDFAYLRKPILYCQFDKQEFFSGEHAYTQGYFDYEKDGFGEVAYDLDKTIDLILEYAASRCELKDIYRKRINDFFEFNDQENCRRVVEKIKELTHRD